MPRRIVEIALSPLSATAQAKLEASLADPPEGLGPFEALTDAESGFCILRCESEAQVTMIVNWLRRELDLLLNVGTPQVAYRETLGVPVDIDRTHKNLVGVVWQFARVKIRFQPLPPGGGEVFENQAGDAIPPTYVAAIEKGIRAVEASGIITGFPVIDYKATLIDGAHHDVDSSALAFEMVARAAFREAAKSAQPKLLEPIMAIEIAAPNEYAAPILRDLRLRRAVELISRRDGADCVIVGEAPLSNLFGYDETLARLTGGSGRLSSRFQRYAPIPQTPRPPDDDGFPPAIGKRA